MVTSRKQGAQIAPQITYSVISKYCQIQTNLFHLHPKFPLVHCKDTPVSVLSLEEKIFWSVSCALSNYFEDNGAQCTICFSLIIVLGNFIFFMK